MAMAPDDPRARPLRRSDLDGDPFRQFGAWFEEARSAGVPVPEAMSVATSTAAGAPSVRMVLLKHVDERGFVFHTSYESRKGRELAENPRAALLFYWHELGRQVRVEGAVQRVSREDSDAYFATRPPEARLSAWASRQSEPVPSRAVLEERVAELLGEYRGREVPPPPFWGGFRVSPWELEFWQHRANRLHDRFRYRRDGAEWAIERLSP